MARSVSMLLLLMVGFDENKTRADNMQSKK